MKTIRPRDADYQPPESLGGQMTDLERQKLFDWVYESIMENTRDTRVWLNFYGFLQTLNIFF